MSNSYIRLDTAELDRIAARLKTNRKAIGRRIAFEIESEAKQRVSENKSVITGAMMNSIYTVTQDENGYGAASGVAKTMNPDAETAPHPTPSGNIIANVGPCVDYAEYVEMGTSRAVAKPYLTPAAEKVSQKYNDGSAWKELVE